MQLLGASLQAVTRSPMFSSFSEKDNILEDRGFGHDVATEKTAFKLPLPLSCSDKNRNLPRQVKDDLFNIPAWHLQDHTLDE